MTGLSAITLFNLYTKNIMRNAGLDDLQAGIKCRYVDDTTLMAESKEEHKGLLRVKEESERAGLQINI